ncbi:MAG: GatB/YqeY domain-containing protein [Sphingomonadales bacterium]|nr:GatB/YqeY domain-containing protein [Sphingomonadales bacterium]
MLRDQLKEALKDAMRAKEKVTVGTLRLILAAVKDRDIADRTEQSESDDDLIITEILSKMIKQRRDSITAYEAAGRVELAEREAEEIVIIERFLPRQLSDDEIKDAVSTIVSEIGAEGLKDMGRTMGSLKTKYAGQMDFAKASVVVKEQLTG